MDPFADAPALAGLLLDVSTLADAALAFPGDPPVDDPGGVDVRVGLGGGASGAFLTTLVVGAVLVALAPEYTQARIDDVVADPVGSFASGVVALIALIAVIVLLFITIIGIFAAVPLIFLAVLVWAAGAAIGFLAIAQRLVGDDEGWLVPLVVAAAINGVAALTGIGGIVSFCVGAAGFGTVLRAHR